MRPALMFLIENLSTKGQSLMKIDPVSLETAGKRFKRDLLILTGPLRTLQDTVFMTFELISEWTAKGELLCGSLRQFLTAKNFSAKFANANERLEQSGQALQLALSSATFLNVDSALQAISEKRSELLMDDADLRDRKELSHNVQVIMENDSAFKNELILHLDELKTALGPQFEELLGTVVAQSEKTRQVVVDEHIKTRDHITQMATDSSGSLQALRFDWSLLTFDNNPDGPDCLFGGRKVSYFWPCCQKCFLSYIPLISSLKFWKRLSLPLGRKCFCRQSPHSQGNGDKKIARTDKRGSQNVRDSASSYRPVTWSLFHRAQLWLSDGSM